MLSDQALADLIPQSFDGADLAFLGGRYAGKVRDNYRVGNQRVLVVTDRLSAFDRILGRVPYKGQLLNQLAAFWFDHTDDILPNHFLDSPDPNVTVARQCDPLPVEVVVRGYISGVTTTSLWHQYGTLGRRELYGVTLPDGLTKNDPLPQPLITPTTKARSGHDAPITPAEIVARGLVERSRWAEIERAAVALFRRGQQVAREGGLILVDTKYEFGIDPTGTLRLIDELHTPDSSRFWLAESFAARRAEGREPENLDKEFVRLRYAAAGFRGDGEPPPMDEALIVATARRYIECYERLTGRPFEPAPYPVAPRVRRAMRNWQAAWVS